MTMVPSTEDMKKSSLAWLGRVRITNKTAPGSVGVHRLPRVHVHVLVGPVWAGRDNEPTPHMHMSGGVRAGEAALGDASTRAREN